MLRNNLTKFNNLIPKEDNQELLKFAESLTNEQWQMHWQKEAKEYLYGKYAFVDFEKAEKEFNLKPSANRFNNVYDLRYTGIDQILLNAIKKETNIAYGEVFFIHLIQHQDHQNVFEHIHESPKDDYYYFLHFFEPGLGSTIDFIDQGQYVNIKQNLSVLIPIQLTYDYLISKTYGNDRSLYYIKMLVKLTDN